jgi:hypothetical protein
MKAKMKMVVKFEQCSRNDAWTAAMTRGQHLLGIQTTSMAASLHQATPPGPGQVDADGGLCSIE